MKKRTNNRITKYLSADANGLLTDSEVQLLSRQIRYNSRVADHYIEVIDLLINKERCPKDANTLAYLRRRLSIAIAENDTFRKVLWRHMQLAQNQTPYDGDSEAASFLIGQIKSRERALISQMASKKEYGFEYPLPCPPKECAGTIFPQWIPVPKFFA